MQTVLISGVPSMAHVPLVCHPCPRPSRSCSTGFRSGDLKGKSTQQHGLEQAEEPLSFYVVMHLRPSSGCVQMLILFVDLPGDSTTCLELIPQSRDHIRATCNH
ncbi:hypothetical protein TNCV_1326051 [Trichonephila clavipes]|nr:hypothetical protein TNCV_1326051 [Trichonephila clavipes]